MTRVKSAEIRRFRVIRVPSLSCYRRAAIAGAGGLLEGVGQLQHAKIVLVAAHNLHTHGQPFRGEA